MREKLTDPFVKNVQLKGKSQDFYQDELVTGFVLCVGKKRKTFFATYQDGDKNNRITRWRKLGNYPTLEAKTTHLRLALRVLRA